MDEAAVDPKLLAKLDRESTRSHERPADVEDALGTPSKQFQLLNVNRETLGRSEPTERVSVPRIGSEALGKPPRGKPEATLETVRFVAASTIGKRAFQGFRALLRSALGKQYKPSSGETA